MAEMYGEVMELNERLHKDIAAKDKQSRVNDGLSMPSWPGGESLSLTYAN